MADGFAQPRAAAPPLVASILAVTHPLGVALFGAGRIGAVHAANVAAHPGSRLLHVVDLDDARGQHLAAAHGARTATADEVFADDAVGAVVIASSTDTHAPLLERGAAAGKAVFCEKPIALDLARVRTCLARVGSPSAPVMVGFNRRFDPSFALLERRVRVGEIGDLELVTVVAKDPSPPTPAYIRGSGGLFRDMTIHDLDMVRFLLAEEPVRVCALASSVVDREIGRAGDVDTAVVSLETASGKLAVITNSRRSAAGYDQRVEVHGSEGTLRADNLQADTVTRLDATGVHGALPPAFFLERYAEAYRTEWAHFVECAASGATPSATLRDGERALALAEAALESLATGRTAAVS